MERRTKNSEKFQKVGYTVPEAGEMVGLCRATAYDAAARGEIPTLRFGRKLIVPKAAWDRKLGIGVGHDDGERRDKAQ